MSSYEEDLEGTYLLWLIVMAGILGAVLGGWALSLLGIPFILGATLSGGGIFMGLLGFMAWREGKQIKQKQAQK